MSLPYPGGPALAAIAGQGSAERFAFPRPLADRGLDLSFSGLKTAVRLAVEAERAAGRLDDGVRADIAASFQAAAVDTLAAKCRRALAATGLTRLVVAGGVGANRLLRERLAELARELGVALHFPRPALCTDNGAMIAYAGARRLEPGGVRGARILARPRWSLEELEPPDTAGAEN